MTHPPTTPRTRNELNRDYRRVLERLTNYSDDYHERGRFIAAYDMATIIRVLVHDTSVSKSLLGQLDLKDATRFLDARVFNNLCMPGIVGGYTGFMPRTRTPHVPYTDKHLHPFDEWWTSQEFVVSGTKFTRFDLVTVIANKEGGAHVDPATDQRIAHINRTKSPWTASGGGEEHLMYGAELASVCAIAEEILFSLTPEPENRKRMFSEDYQKPPSDEASTTN